MNRIRDLVASLLVWVLVIGFAIMLLVYVPVALLSEVVMAWAARRPVRVIVGWLVVAAIASLGTVYLTRAILRAIAS